MNPARTALVATGRASPRAAPAAVVLLGLLWAVAPASAQIGINPADVVTDILTDGSFGDSTQVMGVDGVFEIPESLGDRPGENGKNLFHSFDRFDLATDDVGLFTAEHPTINVISRVTGDDVSKIFGTIKTGVGLEDAHFYFLNPHGVVFGPGARLDVKGSFHVSTADELGFDGAEVFVARLGGAVPTMAMANPVDFGFWVDDAAPAGIWFDKTEATNFAVSEDKTLSVVAGSIVMVGDRFEEIQEGSNVAATGGVVQLAAVPAGTGLKDTRIPVVLSEFKDVEALRSDDALIYFTGGGGVQVTGSGFDAPAQIVIRAGRFEMARAAGVGGGFSGILKAEKAGRESGSSFAIDVEVAGAIELDQGEIFSITTVDDSSGDIRLVGDEITLAGVTIVSGEIFKNGSGPGPSVVVDAKDGVLEISGGSQLRTQDEVVEGLSEGKVGDITVNAFEVSVTGSGVVKNAVGENVVIESAIVATSRGFGDGAVVSVNADRVIVADRGEIKAVRLQSLQSLDVAPDDPGRVEVNAGELLISGGAIGSVTQGSGRGADVTVTADSIHVESQLIEMEGEPAELLTGQISTITQRTELALPPGFEIDYGQGGNLTIQVGSELQPGLVELTSGGQIRAVTRSDSDAGNLELNIAGGPLLASGALEFVDEFDQTQTVPSGVFSRSESGATGDGGGLQIAADSVLLEDGAEISARTETDGDAGDLLIVAHDLVSVRGDSTISARGAGGSIPSDGDRPGNGGNLTIDTDVLEVLDGGQVSASAAGTGDAKDVNITAREILVSGEGSGVFAQALGRSVNAGRAGNLILAPHEGERMTLRVLDGGELSVEADEFGAPGDIEIRGADLVEVASGGSINARVERVILRPGETPDDLPELASDIRITDTDKLVLAGGTITAETIGTGPGGQILIQGVNNVLLKNGSSITTSSTSTSENAGDAGAIVIAATKTFRAKNSEITTTAMGDAAGGGRISIQARDLVDFTDSLVETTVDGEAAGADAGDIFISLGGEEVVDVDPVVPEFVVINRSVIRANAVAEEAGDITIDGSDVFISADSIIEAHSETGLSGEIQISAPDTDIASQVAQLPSSFVDPSDRLLPPCVARTERTGSFMVQNREALPRSLDAPLPSGLTGAPGVDGTPPASDSTDCSVFQERS